MQERAEALERAEESCNIELAEDSCSVALDSMASCTVASVLALCGHCVAALEQGVTRAHLVPPVGGALLNTYPNPDPDPNPDPNPEQANYSGIVFDVEEVDGPASTITRP